MKNVRNKLIKQNFTKLTRKSDISLIVPYYETLKASKIGKVPPKNKIETMKKLINISRVVDFEVCYF